MCAYMGVCVDVADAVKRCVGEGYAVFGGAGGGTGALGYGLGTCGRSPCVQCFCQLLCGVLVWVCRSQQSPLLRAGYDAAAGWGPAQRHLGKSGSGGGGKYACVRSRGDELSHVIETDLSAVT
jgi:hypothetical protein